MYERTPHTDCTETRIGLAYGLAAYLWWGLAPIYFKAVAAVPAVEVLAHRVVWSAVLLAGLLLVKRRVREALGAVRDRRTAGLLAVTTVLIAVNWLTFIFAVANGYLLQASLGYYVNPLLNVVLGFVILRERLRPLQWVSVAIAAVGVAYFTLRLDTFPWVAAVLAVTFGTYGLLRKTARVEALTGLAVETTLLAPLAAGYMVYLWTHGGKFGQVSRRLDVLLVAAGVVTTLPLLWFTHAARRLRFVTIGFLQYVAPSAQFLLAVLAFGERFTPAHAVTFGCIWAALILFSTESVLRYRAAARRDVRAVSPLGDS
ncbi:MAG: chloramphenicol resistance permease RarD [Methyloceanibacter sp.]|nr:MAG: chloramphenicol resistance permease RarD [Methyloceanibacter sp.]